MRAITARDANQSFSELLSSVEQGEEVVITKRGRPVAVLSPYQHPERTPEREAAGLMRGHLAQAPVARVALR